MFDETKFDGTNGDSQNEQNFPENVNGDVHSEKTENVTENARPVIHEETAFQSGEDILTQSADNVFSENTISAEDSGSSNLTDGAEEFVGGVAYTKDIDGKTANGYEWNTSGDRHYTVSYKKEPTKKSSGKGFRVFIGAVLTVFTISIVIMAAFVVRYFVGESENAPVSAKSPSSWHNSTDITTSDKYNYDSVTIDNDNFVPYDFAEHEGQVLSIPEVAAKCSPSTVGIIAEIETSYYYPFYFSPSTRVTSASGSGFIYSAEGYIITNHHVIEDAQNIKVVLYNGNEYDARLIGSDALSDIAVLKIEPDDKDVLIPMEIGDSNKVVVGEPVVAIGCPAGIQFIGTVTDGIVSAINRNVKITDEYGNTEKVMTLIQTNATINHGNSGGPLINAKGQVIGINTLKLAQDYEGIGFSIPINGAVSIINQLIDHGSVIDRDENNFVSSKGMIGINGSEISQSEANYYGIPRGVLVLQIESDSSASKAGLRRGDIITHYNGNVVNTIADINTQKGSALAGEEVTLTVFRDDSTFDITFKLDPEK